MDPQTCHRTGTMYGIALGIAALLAVGCATTPPYSGFLDNYEGFQKDSKDESKLIYEKPGVDWNAYTKLLIDPVVVYYHPDVKNPRISPEDLKKLTDYFHEVLVEEVKDVCPLVDAPGADVIRLRVAITDVTPTDPVTNVLTTAGLGLALDLGGASIEAEFVDSVSDERLAAVIDRKVGAPIALNAQMFTELGHAKGAFREWAKELRTVLQEP